MTVKQRDWETEFYSVCNFRLIAVIGLVAILLDSVVLEQGLFHFWYFSRDELVMGIDASIHEQGLLSLQHNSHLPFHSPDRYGCLCQALS